MSVFMSGEQILTVLELIAKAANIDGPLEQAGFGAVRALLALLQSGLKGDVLPDDVLKEAAMLAGSLKETDLTADTELQAKFNIEAAK